MDSRQKPKKEKIKRPKLEDLTLNPRPLMVKLDRDTLLEFKIALFRLDVSVQEALEEFAKLVVSKHDWGTRIVKDVAKRKIGKKVETYVPDDHKKISEQDAESLYSLLEDENIGKDRYAEKRFADDEDDM